MEIVCARCGKTADKPAGHVGRARARGLNVYCDRRCAGLGRRKHKSKAQKIEEKRLYDIAYRQANGAKLKAAKAAYNKRTYDPIEAAKVRKERMPYHVEYCRRPAYRAVKREYDKKRRASEYGPAAEAYTILLDLNREIKERMTSYEIKQENGTFGKRQARAREEASADKGARNRNRAA